jgi:hypothetical protein
MDKDQEMHEKAVGMKFIKWYNNSHGTAYQFVGRPDKAPDLIFSDELQLEVTDSYYDIADAELQWKMREMFQLRPNNGLVSTSTYPFKHISDCIANKSQEIW